MSLPWYLLLLHRACFQNLRACLELLVLLPRHRLQPLLANLMLQHRNWILLVWMDALLLALLSWVAWCPWTSACHGSGHLPACWTPEKPSLSFYHYEFP